MTVRAVVAKRIKRAEEFAGKLMESGQQVYEAVSAAGKEGIAELQKAGGVLEPRVRLLVSDSVNSIRELLDEANQALADLAVPAWRKAGVVQKRLEQKFEQVGKARGKGRRKLTAVGSESGVGKVEPVVRVVADSDTKPSRVGRQSAETQAGNGDKQAVKGRGPQQRSARRKTSAGSGGRKRGTKDPVPKVAPARRDS